ncbi:AMP-binding protein [Variovorax sp. RB2P76]|uniref:AMP-binding protein n=1 Tax=Variovorax sp. RB2P76 TaxID=3443736 RepID=UPI003F470C97
MKKSPVTIPALLDSAALYWPQRVAVRCEGHSATYLELSELAARIENNLLKLGCQPGDRVAFRAEKSIEVIALMIGICRSVCVYVPIEAQLPAPKVDHILADCGAKLLVVDNAADEAVQDGILKISLKALLQPSEPAVQRTPWKVRDIDLAYILYTSGSTGLPKGVAVTHRAAMAFLDWANTEFEPGLSDVFANHASLSFDLSVLDIYLPMYSGACVVLIQKIMQIQLGELTRLIRNEGITVWYSVPSALILMTRHGGLLHEDVSCLRLVLFAGEPFPVKDLRPIFGKMSGHAKFYNLYGPTETNVCSFHQVRELPVEDTESIPIGQQCSGDRLVALDEGGEVITAPGQTGVLWVEGPSVMAGYWGALSHPARYCTGDFVTLDSNDDFVYLGRRDHVVKIRGVRLSLLAVEAAVRATTNRDICAVVDGSGADARLLVLVAGVSRDDEEMAAIEKRCRDIPKPERPDLLHPIEAIPLNENGKVDRIASYRLIQKARESMEGRI